MLSFKCKHLVTHMALREAGEKHHDNAGRSRKLSAVSAAHTTKVKYRHYEKVGEDFEEFLIYRRKKYQVSFR